MKKNFGPKSVLFPQPVFVIGTYNEDGSSNAMTAAWGGMYDTNTFFVCLDTSHLTTDNIKRNKEFTVMFATKKTAQLADYFGIETGRKEDKIAKSGVSTYKSENVNAPLFEEFPVAIECKAISLNENDGSCYVIAEITNLVADESVLTNGVIDVEKLEPIAYNASTHTYVLCKEFVAKAFNSGFAIKNK